MLRTEVADRQLRRFVVRIVTPDGAAACGSGVLVAPGWVLTCAHVVEDLDAVRVIPDQRAAADSAPAPSWVAAQVRGRSEARDASSTSVFWPFPDLALLELNGWTDHVCAPLTTEEPGRAGEAHAWGFGRREEGVTAVGSAASFRYVGVDGDGYLQLKAGDAPPGLSGAPLVCPQRRAVVGVMSVSRDPGDARGGWAGPVSALAGGAEVPEDLARLGYHVLGLNREAAWRHRHAWHAALPIPEAKSLAVERPWLDAEVDRASAQPSTMLRAEFRVVPYRFRDADLHNILTWCESRPRLAVSYIDAAGGAGKTRFAIEACLAAQAKGWVAGMLPKMRRSGDSVTLPRLFIVDYVEERDAHVLIERLSALAATATMMAPVRVLLLSRPVSGLRAGRALDALKELASGQALTALETAKDNSSAAEALSESERGQLFEEARQRFGQTWHGPGWQAPPGATPDLSGGRYARPLDVLFEAYDAALSGPGWQQSNQPPVDRALDHEIRHWRARMGEVDHKLLVRCVALTTLAGAPGDAEAEAVFALIPELAGESAAGVRRRLDQWLRGLYEGPDRWNPLRPDRLGEALIIRTLRADEDGGLALLTATLALRSDTQLERVLEVLGRLVADSAIDEIVATALVQHHAALVRRCAEQARGTRQRPGRIRLLDGLARLHIKLLTDERVAALPLPAQSVLRISADKLGDLAREHGRSTQAQAIFEGALVIDKRKHELEPGNTTYRRDLSVSYERLADLALAAGRSGDAEALYRQALQVAEELTELEPGNTTYRRDLSISYNKLADLALAAGRSVDAEALYRQALQVREELTELEPGNTTYRRDLSISYERLAALAAQAGEVDAARQLVGQAVNIRRAVHELEPQRVDVAVELAYALYLSAEIASTIASDGAGQHEREEIMKVLIPFENANVLSSRGHALLRWARANNGDDS